MDGGKSRMKAFHCDHCGSLIFFESVSCVHCGHALGFVPAALDMSALVPEDNGTWRPLAKGASEGLYRNCINGTQHAVCNWLVPLDAGDTFCVSCRLNRTIPDLNFPGNQDRWHRLEKAKRRAVYTFLKLGLPLQGPDGSREHGLRFEFLADAPGSKPVLTGHDDGLITLNLLEADDVERERRRVSLREPLRTLLGHFRHEMAHYCWDRLVAGSPWRHRFRELFGDESADYSAALQRHYAQGPPADWQTRFVSEYSSAHPWEDWAETCAHYFHMIDMLETAASFGLSLKPRHPSADSMTVDANKTATETGEDSFDVLFAAWGPLTVALNAFNRGMGLSDLYPFILSDPVVRKLRMIHRVLSVEAGGI
jgi:hypothetical protein